MKKILLGIVFISLLATIAAAAEVLVKEPTNKPAHTDSVVLLNAVSSTGAGTSYWLGFLPHAHTWQIDFTGTASTISVKLQGSIDNSNWFDLDTSTSTTASIMRHVVNKPINYIRANLVTFTNGTTMTVRSVSGAY